MLQQNVGGQSQAARKVQVKFMRDPSEEHLADYLNDGWQVAHEEFVVKAPTASYPSERVVYCCRLTKEVTPAPAFQKSVSRKLPVPALVKAPEDGPETDKDESDTQELPPVVIEPDGDKPDVKHGDAFIDTGALIDPENPPSAKKILWHHPLPNELSYGETMVAWVMGQANREDVEAVAARDRQRCFDLEYAASKARINQHIERLRAEKRGAKEGNQNDAG